MASRVLRYSQRAQQDFRHLLAHSEQEWSIEQANAYEDAMFAALDILREHPLFGVNRPDIALDVHSHRMQRHVIYYRVMTDSIYVLRILHQRQSTIGQFDVLDDE